MTPLGWKYALALCGYAIVWFVINDLVKIKVYRLMQLGTAIHLRHLASINASLHPAGVPAKVAPPTIN